MKILGTFILFTLTLVLSSRAASAAVPQLVLQWGSQGSGPGQFNRPTGICVDRDSNVYVVDLNRVQKFTSDGTYLGSFGGTGSGPGQFSAAIDVAVDPSGRIYVTDAQNIRTQVFDNAFNYITQWNTISESYITIDPTGTYAYLNYDDGKLADPDSVRQFALATGKEVRAWTYSHVDVYGLSTGASGAVYLATQAYMVTKYSSSGTFQTMWGSEGTGPGQFLLAGPVAVGPDETVYVSDQVNPRIQIFSQFGTLIGQFGTSAIDLAVDSGNNIYVLTASSVQKYSYASSTPTLRDTWAHLKQLYR